MFRHKAQNQDKGEKQNIPFLRKLKRIFIGRARNIKDKALFRNTSLVPILAWAGLGSDCLTSSCYGPHEAFLALGDYRSFGIIIALMTAFTIFIISSGYNLINNLFPEGGGGYYVSGRLLSAKLGMISGCALILDYILVISISIVTGTEALFSLIPVEYAVLKPFVSYGLVLLLIILNLRGVRESITFLLPIFLLFILSHALILTYSIATNISEVKSLGAKTISDFSITREQIGTAGVLFIILNAFVMGAGTFTGIEAISNGMPILREPKTDTARTTMAYMAVSLSFMVIGLMVSYLIYNVQHVPQKTLNASLFELITKHWGNWGNIFVIIILISEASLLYVASQTGFLAGPRVLSNMANDKWLPTSFAMLSDRLVVQKGILLLGLLAAIMIFISNHSVKFLIIIFSINVFTAFSLAQLGMVKHWWQERKNGKWIKKFLINTISFLVCAFILITIVVLKFNKGGWITLFITGILIAFTIFVKRHYRRTAHKLKKLDILVQKADEKLKETLHSIQMKGYGPIAGYEPNKTAVYLVSGFNGSGISTLLSSLKLFDGNFKNMVFVEVGVLNTDTFRSQKVIHHMDEEIKSDLKHYVDLVNKYGFEGKAIRTIGTDVSEEALKVAPSIMERYPDCIFFGGQLLFPKDTIFTRYLHNYAAFSLQKNFYERGIPFIVLPIDIT